MTLRLYVNHGPIRLMTRMSWADQIAPGLGYGAAVIGVYSGGELAFHRLAPSETGRACPERFACHQRNERR